MLRFRKILPFLLTFVLLFMAAAGTSAEQWPDEGICHLTKKGENRE